MIKGLIVMVLVALATANQQLRVHDMQHDLGLPFIGDLNPIQAMQLMSGDYASILPGPLQPLARKILGQEKQSGPAGFMNSVSNMFGGSGSGNGGLFGGMGDLFGSGKQSGGAMSNIMSAFGGKSSSSGSGILSSLGLPF